MSETQFNLNGRQAIVTGAGRGIGRAIAERFLKSGASVELWDVDPIVDQAAKELSAMDSQGTVTFARVNVANYEEVSEAVEQLVKRNGQIDILCSNAGIAGPTHTVWEYPLDDWLQVQDINVNGVFYGARAVVPHMIKNNYGRIINTASIAGKEGNPNASAYSTSKAAVIGLTKSLGKELAEYNIAVNCITPVTADTRILEQVTPEFIEYMRSKIPRGRFITVEEIAATVTWMASEENAFTTASVYDLSGGRATY